MARTYRAPGLDFFEVLLKFIGRGPLGAPFLKASRGLARGPLGGPFLIKIQKVIATQVNMLYDQNKPVNSYSKNNLL